MPGRHHSVRRAARVAQRPEPRTSRPGGRPRFRRAELSPHRHPPAALTTRPSCSAGRAASAARYTITWARRAWSGSSRAARRRPGLSKARAAQLVPQRSRTFPAGSVTGCQDEAVHQMANLEPPGQDLITLHVYSPPPSQLELFHTRRDHAGRPRSLAARSVPRRSSSTSHMPGRSPPKDHRSRS